MSRLRVVSYNIHKGRSGLMSRVRLNELRLGLYGLGADLVFLQEVQGRNERAGVLDAQHESLAAALHLDMVYGCNAVRRYTDHGNALLSRFPILSHENLNVSDHRLEQRGLLHAQVRIGDHMVHCFVVHLGLFGASRGRQAEALIRRIDEVVRDGEPVLIAGDFNDWNDDLSATLVERLGLHEVFGSAQLTKGGGPPKLRETVRLLRQSFVRLRDGAGPSQPLPALSAGSLPVTARPPRTFPSAMPMFRLDRIYQRGFAVRRARVLRGMPWTRISDHAPLMAELELP
ncbi:endonuclease/exonuclease/phosphatase family protein [Achromobacter sp. GG226]|uniref:endonuclease/exonuclease/phosphatase family protein n=1 Tax=Verticiella alkaliphila TaxID=2779529 RepID=UPI001C0C8E79|nr:endonuclease/exonuclease/phosphatase family protein [Verticiella sp. GG226]MBU4609894.1 endonuclease/exonuclease/phosphatase family protein [Verticiella sp. GG226]